MAKKDVRIAFNMLPIHRQALEAIASADGEGLSVILRRLIRDEAKARGLWPEPKLDGKGDGHGPVA